jgi:SAM-dependent methyltransferase
MAERETLAFCIEHAGFENRLRCGTINHFSGFVGPEPENPTVHVRFSVEGETLGTLPIDVERPEFARVFPTTILGFAGVVSIPESCVGKTLLVEAVFKNGGAFPLGEYSLDTAVTVEERAFKKINNIPDDRLIYSVITTLDPVSFLERGKLGVDIILELLKLNNIDLACLRAVLDFGVGCGRVFRWWEKHARGIAFHGTDINEEAIAWCRENLPFGTFSVNSFAPPTAYGEGTFDLIYAYSVFPHLLVETQEAWLCEFHRILSSGGHALISVYGDSWARKLQADLYRSFKAKGFLELSRGAEGENVCSTFQDRAFSENLFSPYFELVGHYPESLQACGNQDLHLLRKKM